MRLKNLLLTFLIVVLSLFSFSPSSVLASCVPAVSFAEYKEQADIVILGRVMSISNASAVINVERYFKGHGGPSQIEVSGKESDSTVTSVDFAFEEDKKYLLFLKTSSGNLKTNACMGNKEVQDTLSEKDLALLGTGDSPNNGTVQDLSSSKTNEEAGASPNRSVIAVVGALLIVGVVAVSWKKWSKTHSK